MCCHVKRTLDWLTSISLLSKSEKWFLPPLVHFVHSIFQLLSCPLLLPIFLLKQIIFFFSFQLFFLFFFIISKFLKEQFMPLTPSPSRSLWPLTSDLDSHKMLLPLWGRVHLQLEISPSGEFLHIFFHSLTLLIPPCLSRLDVFNFLASSFFLPH